MCVFVPLSLFRVCVCVVINHERLGGKKKGERVALLGFPLEILLKEEPDIEGDEVENFSALNVSLLY